MVEDNPKMNELEELHHFCKKYNIYIYGHDITSMNVSKYLYFSGVKIKGFIKPEVLQCDIASEPFPIVNLAELNTFSKKEKQTIGVIICAPTELYNQIIGMLQIIGIRHYYIISEWNKRTLVKKMAPRTIEDFYLEVNLADHCNLNCQCCDHFSPIASETFLDFDQYVCDIK